MTDSPDIEFVYDDADTYQNEMSGKSSLRKFLYLQTHNTVIKISIK
jgi:hypothetical protein